MRNKDFEIDYPDITEINTSINHILDNSFPSKRKFLNFLIEMHQQLGWRYIFRDYLELGLITIVFLLATSLYMVWVIQGYAFTTPSSLYGSLFIGSPLLFMSVSIFSLLDKKETFEIEMACKYNVYQVMAYRMLIFGILSILINIIQIGILSTTVQELNFAMGIMLSLTALFLFATVFLYVTKTSTSRIKQIVTTVSWVMINVGLMAFNNVIYTEILMRVPVVVYILIISVSVYLALNNMKKLTTANKRRLNYVNSI